jgi:hypothetical protein
MTLSIMTLSIMTLNIMTQHNDTQHNDTHHNDTQHNVSLVFLNAIHAECRKQTYYANCLLLNVVMPSVIVQYVMAPLFLLNNNILKVTKNVILLIKCC